jgi:pSer/pThr/pTyr-binding forkhead associated (FHA) protein
MAFIQLNEKQIPIGSQEVSIGGHAGATVPVPQAGTAGPAALVRETSDGKALIRRGDGGVAVKVNGVALGVEPAPLLHGDKIDVAGVEFTFSEDQKSGSTQFLSSSQLAELAAMRKQMRTSGGGSKPTANTGGRLVSLVDGREYPVPAKGLMIGRDASCDVVIPSNDVSRNHAEVQVGPDGYYVIDLSTNGVFVNGSRIEGTQTLGRADVIRLANEEFRFYADTPRGVEPTPAAGMPVIGAAAPAPSAPAAAPVAAAPPPPPPPPTAPILATLEIINEGPTKGTKYELRGPLSNVGRGAHNDVVIQDSSISDQHAKIIRREGEWYVQDAHSTNGTYVGGKRIEGEAKLVGAPDVRFGSVKLSFRPAAVATTDDKGTKVIAGIKTAAPAAETPRRETAEAAPVRSSATPAKGGVPPVVWIVVGLVVVGAVVFFAMQGR